MHARPFHFSVLMLFWRREKEEGNGQESERTERRRNSPFFSEPPSPSYLFLSVVCSSVLIFRREFLLPLRCLSFVIHKRNEEETRPSSPCSFSLHSASLHLNAFFTHALIFMSTGRLSLFFFLPSGTPPWEILSRDPRWKPLGGLPQGGRWERS